MPSVKKHSAKKVFAECFLTLDKEAFAECFSLTLDKELLCRVSENKHSAKYLILGKMRIPVVRDGLNPDGCRFVGR